MKTPLKPADRVGSADIVDRTRRFWTRVYSRAAVPYLAVGLLLIILLLAGGSAMKHHLHTIEAWINDLGPWGLLAFIGLFALATSFLLPDSVLCIMAGALFGLRWGVPAVLAGSLLGAMLQFGLAHRLLRDRIQHRLRTRPSLVAIQRAVLHDEFRLQLLLRLTPLNPATISHLLGAGGVRFTKFILACLALTPNLFMEVYFGHVGKHAAQLAGSDVRTARWHDLAISGGLAVCVTVIIVVSRLARKAVMRAVAETEHSGALAEAAK